MSALPLRDRCARRPRDESAQVPTVPADIRPESPAARFVVEPRPVTISAGTSSADLDGSVAIKRLAAPVDPQRWFLSSVEVDRAES